jgi:type III secretion system FlhB-like substrate exporter
MSEKFIRAEELAEIMEISVPYAYKIIKQLNEELDAKGRFRSVAVGFRVSPEEGDLLDRMVALSGLTKQDYIIDRLLNREIIVQGNPKVFKALKHQLAAVLTELQRLERSEDVSDEMYTVIAQISAIMNGMKEESAWTEKK